MYVGFAAETGNPLPEARRKLAAKGLDLIVANDVTRPGAGFEVDTNRVTLVAADGGEQPLPLLSKAAVGLRIVKWVESRAAGGPAPRRPVSRRRRSTGSRSR